MPFARPVPAEAAPRECVTPEDLNVAPALLGQPLARPGRRALAMAIDGLCIAAFNALGNAWVALALAALLLWQRARRKAGLASGAAGAAGSQPVDVWRTVGVAVLLLGLGALTQQEDHRASAADREAARAEAGQVAHEVAREVDVALAQSGVSAPASVASALAAVAARAGASTTVVLDPAVPATPATAASATADADSEAPESEPEPAAQRRLQALQARLAAQDEELQRLRSPGLGAWQARIRHWLDELGEGWLWSLLYFSLLPAGWLGGRPGQTLGKRMMGLRVAELTGKPMTPMRNLKRYGGYAAGMATGGLGLAQLLWDTNRQAIQDKTAHTVVLDLRRPAPPLPAPPQPQPAGDAAAPG